ncbi:MAG: nuclear transport factor 2 family protein [Rubricoccaceae bacterium]|nr:nuclear transport factor 2 family protein [Rubricoccaceae bacterium]
MKTASVILFSLPVLWVGCSGSSRTTTDVVVVSEEEVHHEVGEASAMPTSGEIADGVRAILDDQVAAWNRGDIRGFMRGYERSDSLVFISNGNMRRGWQTSLYAYVRNYPNQAAMGTLSFEDIKIVPLGEDAALVFGMYRLQRENDEPLGLFSLVFKNTEDGWRIIHDHTSSSP